ncbi:MAG TPA: DMT family transporter [Nitrososphaerales archaeon]|nr:DMT family transporter [Nitrososphaerales archaeon]
MPKLTGYFPMFVLSIIWGMAFVAIRRADFELSPVNLTLLRWLIVSAAFLVIYRSVVKPKMKFQRQDLPRLVVVALGNVVIYHLALNTAESTVDASLAGLLISFGPLFIVVLSAGLLHERITTRVWLALGLAIVGAAIISSPDISFGSVASLAPLLVVVAALSNAVYTVASKPLVVKYGPFPVAAWSALLGTVLLLPLVSGSLFAQAEALSPVGWSSVLYLALLSTVLTNLIYFTQVSGGPVSRVGVQLYLVPVVSAIGGVLVLGEGIAPATFVGGALMLIAIALATLRR